MLIPTLGCPSNCSYCWSSEENSSVMNLETVNDVALWLKDFQKDQVTVTFHGGEPLLAGADFYRKALPLISDELTELRPSFAIQTNLWRMTREIAEIFSEYSIPVGSSIDGPKEINDLQRGEGYFEKTMRGYKIAQESGLSVRFICTFTSYSIEYKKKIFEFFLNNNLVLKLHPALPSMKGDNPNKWALSPELYGELLVYLLDRYLENLGKIEVMNINDLFRCVFTRRGSVCTFVDCMGNTFAIGPEGDIYPCYRFVGMPDFVMGHVRTHPSKEELLASEAGQRMLRFKEYVDKNCQDCTHIRYCRGGCPYNAIALTNGEVKGVDPHCIAYKRAFNEINERLNEEMFGSSSIDMLGAGKGIVEGGRPGIMALMQKIMSG